jgi:hypothetical protein
MESVNFAKVAGQRCCCPALGDWHGICSRLFDAQTGLQGRHTIKTKRAADELLPLG